MRARFIGPGDGPGEVLDITLLTPNVSATTKIHAGPDKGRLVQLEFELSKDYDDDGLPIYFCRKAGIEGKPGDNGSRPTTERS